MREVNATGWPRGGDVDSMLTEWDRARFRFGVIEDDPDELGCRFDYLSGGVLGLEGTKNEVEARGGGDGSRGMRWGDSGSGLTHKWRG